MWMQPSIHNPIEKDNCMGGLIHLKNKLKLDGFSPSYPLNSSILGLSQNATDVQFIDMSGPSRRRSVSVAGMVEHGENCANDVFSDSPILIEVGIDL
jgi:hypothetical protein